MNPLVSVVIAVYNGEKYLAETLDSLIEQTLTDWECWIVDDGSTDSTLVIVKEYCVRDKRFNLIVTNGGYGPYFAANLAFRSCKGKMIARVDADDICLPARLEVQTKFLGEHPKVNVCSSQCYIMNVKGPLLSYSDIPNDLNCLRWQLLFHNRLVHSTMMVRKDWFERVGFYPNKALCQDYLIWCRAVMTESIGVCPERLVVWRQHQDSITSSKKDNQFSSTFNVAFNYATEIFKNIDVKYYKCLMSDAWGYKIDDNVELEEILSYFIRLYVTYREMFGMVKLTRKDFRKRYFLVLRRNSEGNRVVCINAIIKFLRFDTSAIFSKDFYSAIFRVLFK